MINLGAQITSDSGPKIKATLDKLSQALRVGADKGERSKQNIQATITSVAELTQAAVDNDAAIREFGSNVRKLSDILADEGLGSGSTGAKANQILAEATRLLEGHRDELKYTFGSTRTIMTALTDNQRELKEFIDVGPMALDNAYNIIDANAGSFRGHMLPTRSCSTTVHQGHLQPDGAQTTGAALPERCGTTHRILDWERCST